MENRRKIHANKDIIRLVNIILNNEICISLIEDIKTLFYIQTMEKLDEIIKENSKLYSGNELEIINKIANCFKSLLNSNLSLDNIRGGFLELLVYTFLNKMYPHNEIFEEVRILYGNFKSNLTFDIVLNFNNDQYNAYECKFSPRYIKRKHIDNLSSLRRLKNIFPYLVVFENILKVKYEMGKLRNDTKRNEFNQILKDFEIISLEDFKNGYFYNY